jgi:hypothetical protein
MQITNALSANFTKQILACIATIGLLFAFVMPAMVGAQIANPQDEDFGLSNTGFQNVGIGKSTDLKGSIANIINIVLGFLGIVAVIIILAGGFKWMTAGGNEDKVAESRQMVIQGIIGLVVIFAAWAIASFVITNLLSATEAS